MPMMNASYQDDQSMCVMPSKPDEDSYENCVTVVVGTCKRILEKSGVEQNCSAAPLQGSMSYRNKASTHTQHIKL